MFCARRMSDNFLNLYHVCQGVVNHQNDKLGNPFHLSPSRCPPVVEDLFALQDHTIIGKKCTVETLIVIVRGHLVWT